MKKILPLLALVLAGLVACASGGGQASALERAQYAYSAAIRWGDLDGAWLFLAPDKRGEGLSEIERNRWKQVQITRYHVVNSEAASDGSAVRMVEIGVANRHTLAERQVHYREIWHWDAEKKAWQLASGLPDLWAGQ